MSTETQLQAMLLLEVPKRLPDVRLFRRNIAVARIHKRVVHFAVAGQCDLYGITRGGRHLEIELKSATGRLSPEQIAWQRWCLEWRVPHIVLHAERDEQPSQTVARWCTEIATL